jgi:hypothetical protein
LENEIGLRSVVQPKLDAEACTSDQAAIAEEAGSVAVMALHAVPVDIRKMGGADRVRHHQHGGCQHSSESNLIQGPQIIHQTKDLDRLGTSAHIIQAVARFYNYILPEDCGFKRLGKL